jgi:phosphatidylserine/phosphatidylglycerophosphate/cardiolipin synthase-like enzyme
MIKRCLLVLLIVLLCGLPVQADLKAFFSPKGGCEKEIVRVIGDAKNQLDVAVYSINNKAILEALKKSKQRGVQIRILTDHVQAAGNAPITLDLVKQGFNLRLHSFGRIMHNKFLAVDKSRVMTGSFNWTQPAENVNEENCIEMDDPSVVAQFVARFEKHLWVVNTSEKSLKHLAKIKVRAAERSLSSEGFRNGK